MYFSQVEATCTWKVHTCTVHVHIHVASTNFCDFKATHKKRKKLVLANNSGFKVYSYYSIIISFYLLCDLT